MKHEHNGQAGAGTDNGRHDDGHDQPEGEETPPGIGIDHSIIPGVPVPETVLVARMTDGSYLLLGYPQREPTAFIARENADVLRQALQGAFGSPVAEVSGDARRYHS